MEILTKEQIFEQLYNNLLNLKGNDLTKEQMDRYNDKNINPLVLALIEGDNTKYVN